jgi:hypothetical protein
MNPVAAESFEKSPAIYGCGTFIVVFTRARTSLHPKPDESNQYSPIIFFQYLLNIIIKSKSKAIPVTGLGGL